MKGGWSLGCVVEQVLVAPLKNFNFLTRMVVALRDGPSDFEHEGRAASFLAKRYVIYTNKIVLGKPHYTSWHSWTGLLGLGLFASMAIGGVAGLDPDWGRCD